MIHFNSTDHLCVLILAPFLEIVIQDHDLPGSNGDNEDNFGDDELTDGKDTDGRSSSEQEDIERDAVFCFPCRMFGGQETFTTVGFSSWNKATERFNNHVGTHSMSWKSFLLAQSEGVESSYNYNT